MRLLKLYLSFVLFFTGHIVAELLLGLDYDWPYKVYNWCMVKSSELDEEGRIWEKVECSKCNGDQYLQPCSKCGKE